MYFITSLPKCTIPRGKIIKSHSVTCESLLHVSPKRRYVSTGLYALTSKKNAVIILNAAITSNFIQVNITETIFVKL